MKNKQETIGYAIDRKAEILSKSRITSADFKELNRINNFLREPEKYAICPNEENFLRVIAEHHGNMFVVVLRVPYAKEAILLKLRKQDMRLLVPFVYTSVVEQGKQKRDESGKCCYRLNAQALRDWVRNGAGALFSEKISLDGQTWQSFANNVKPTARRNNLGCAFEEWLCKKLEWQQIGEKDRRGHNSHNDAIDQAGNEWEIKLESGYFSSQFITKLHYWAE